VENRLVGGAIKLDKVGDSNFSIINFVQIHGGEEDGLFGGATRTVHGLIDEKP
jgi:hypothetical protein